MLRRFLTVVLAVAFAYGAGFVADASLNDDPCSWAAALETDRIESVTRLLPVRTDCRVRTRGGRFRSLARGDTEVFWATFAGALVIAFAVLARIARLVRLLLILGAVAGAVYVVFV